MIAAFAGVGILSFALGASLTLAAIIGGAAVGVVLLVGVLDEF